jgi:hypothetical protein
MNEHGELACEDLSCVVTACDQGYDDCNANPNDGCETGLLPGYLRSQGNYYYWIGSDYDQAKLFQ